LDMITRLFCDPGDPVIAEGPSYGGALGSFSASPARVVHVAADGDGLVPGLREEARTTVASQRRPARLPYTTPNARNPAGAPPSVTRSSPRDRRTSARSAPSPRTRRESYTSRWTTTASCPNCWKKP